MSKPIDPTALGQSITASIVAYTGLATAVLAAVGPAAEALKGAAVPLLASLRDDLAALAALVKQKDLLTVAEDADLEAKLEALDAAIDAA